MATPKKRHKGMQKRSKSSSSNRGRNRNRGSQGEGGRQSGSMGSEDRE